MRSRRPNTETILLLLVGGGLILTGYPKILSPLLNYVYEWPEWETRSSTLSTLTMTYGLLFMALSLLSYAHWHRKGDSFSLQFLNYTKDAVHAAPQHLNSFKRHVVKSRSDLGWLIVVFIVAVGIRAYFLAQPMRYDESYTFLNFVNIPYDESKSLLHYLGKSIFFLVYYPQPNNHVLHTILVKLSTSIWGAHPVSIRLPAFLAGLALIPVTFYLCRTLVGPRSGLLASLGVAVIPYLVLYSTMARGYALMVLFSLTVALVGVRLVSKPSLPNCALVSVLAALGMLTIPSMLFAVTGLYLWIACLLLVERRSIWAMLRHFMIPCGIMTSALTLVFYTPTIAASNGVEAIVANSFVRPLPWSDFWRQMGPHLHSAVDDFARDIPTPLLAIAIALMLAGHYAAWRKRNWPVALLLPAMLLGSIFVFFAKHSIPFARTWIYFIPFALILADSGFSYLGDMLSSRQRSYVPPIIVTLGFFYAMSLISKDTIARYPDTGYFPEASTLVKYLKPLVSTNYSVHAATPADWPTNFYLWYYEVPQEMRSRRSNGETQFFVVQKSQYSIDDLTDQPVRRLLEFDDAALYRTLHREER